MANASNLTNAQATVRNANTFTEQLNILNKSAVGVILCRTREPYRAVHQIRAFAWANNLAFKNWTMASGWETPKKAAPESAPEVDNVKDMVVALNKIGGFDGSNGFDDGFYTMMYPHFWLKSTGPNPMAVQVIKDYCRLFSEDRRRLVLVTPPEFTLPLELQEDVVILDFDAPSHAELSDTYTRLVTSFGDKAPRFNPEAVNRILAAGAGMTQHEFETAVSRAVVTHAKELPNVSIDKIVSEVMRVKVEVVKRSEVLEVMSGTEISDVGGLENLKDWLRKRALCFSQDAREFGIEAPKGIALIGPPGTGKSLCAKATANLLGLPLIKFDVSRIFQSLVGQSEERVRSALKMLEAMAPCVVMLDEVDKAFQTGSGGDSGVSQRVLGLILTFLQENEKPIFWVASANRVDNLPSEFLRRGRLDEVFSVSIPDEAERMEVLRIHLRKRGKNPDEVGNLIAAARNSNGYVPAEIEAAVKDALIEAYTGEEEITGDLIAAQLANMKPLSEAFADQFNAMRQWAEQNARPASANRPAVSAPRTRARAAPRPAEGARGGMDLDG